jgi:hypothetical protein
MRFESEAAAGVDVLSHKKKAAFWNGLVELFPNIIDYLCNPNVNSVSDHDPLVLAWLGLAWLGSARLGSARLGSARLGSARLGSARLGLAWLGLAWLGSARLGSARLGSARLGSAWLGLAPPLARPTGPVHTAASSVGLVRVCLINHWWLRRIIWCAL